MTSSPTPALSPSPRISRTCTSRPSRVSRRERRPSRWPTDPMLLNIFLFDFEQRLRRLSTYVYFVVFFALGLLFTLMSGGAFANASVDFGTGGKVLITSPYARS